MREMELQYRPFLPSIQQMEEEIQGQENLGTDPFWLHSMEDCYFTNWWVFTGVLVLCRDAGIWLLLTCRAQKSLLDACPVHMAHRTSAAAVYDLSIILSLLLLFPTVYGSALGWNMCNSYLLNRTVSSQSHLLTVSKQFIAFAPVSFAETVHLNCKAGALLTTHLQSSP